MGQIKPVAKINYLDHLRVLLTVLVILHHAFITYGAPGGWYYTQKTTLPGALVPMSIFVATNQAFFMGFFFFISALFTEPSYNKKGWKRFMADRLIRLGLPLTFYTLLFGPCINYLVYVFGQGHRITFTQYLIGYDDWVDFGVLWFVAALLILTLAYVMAKQFTKGMVPLVLHKITNQSILLFALVLGVISYFVRIYFPVGAAFHPLGFQLSYFTQYIAMFALGVVASRTNLLSTIGEKKGWRWFFVAVVLIFCYPLLVVVKLATHSPISTFLGGGKWQSLVAAVGEQLTGIAIMVAMVGICKQKWNNSTPLLQKLARSAYTTYIIHPLFVIAAALLLKTWTVDPALKLLVVAPIAVVSSFFVAMLLVKLPGIKNVV